MQVNAHENGELLELVNAQNESLGQIVVECADSELVCGAFTPGPLFATVESLFRDHEKAINLQSLPTVDELDAQIARLGLSVIVAAGPRVNIADVQIWSDGAMSFRPVGQEASLLKGAT